MPEEEENSSTRKRKASPSSSLPRPAQDAKRAKQQQQDQESLSERQRRASQEEKSRGRRLFGGLLSTLAGSGHGNGSGSGKSATQLLQQRRRQEIEKRQLDKIQKQTVESDKLRAEKKASLTKIRLERQIEWEEQVMKSRHAKELKLAQFLRTKSKPELCFLPWKLTRDQQDTIEKQVRDCKASITTELQDFQRRRDQHRKRYAAPVEDEAAQEVIDDSNKPVSSNTAPVPKEESPPEEMGAGPKVEPESVDPSSPTSSPPAKKAKPEEADAHQNSHDDSGDILVEADEDMVIY
ncbi:hypothetical protein L249_2194 [Ophiocordyceps polyrhachis-furcata BCC 54312]|uniref:Pinin/SDK/MemA protein domain-containing protein n=1 Tax=Ophiocordyceps polyrhachis-furcata BCC 54312 TaxID=1330021 RepID=A0A367LNH9_9HYPO|nr:hypothetical protein L249_2194 [Ophiocordyceps polyrhachis-furcata BCC 54312]